MHRTQCKRWVVSLVACICAVAAAWAQRDTVSTAPQAITMGPIVDVHVHLMARTLSDYQGAVKTALAVMDQFGVRKMIVMPPPEDGVIIADNDYESFLPVIQNYPTRFAFLGGGGRLNAMIQQTPWQTPLSDSQKHRFTQEAEEVLRKGAIGFGEIAVHHLSYGPRHPYEFVPGDHPLLCLLADIAAAHDVPLDLHFDVVTDDMPTPDFLTSPLDPKRFTANIAPFERLLAHNPKAKIIWEHLGTDTLGCWSASLSRRLLEAHPNLYMALRIPIVPGRFPLNYPLMRNGQMKPEFLRLFRDYPKRFVIGSDMFVQSPDFHSAAPIAEAAKQPVLTYAGVDTFLNALPPEIARMIARDNASTLYKLAQ